MQIDPLGRLPETISTKKNPAKGSGFQQALQSASYDGFFAAAGEKWQVPPAVLKAIAQAESGFNPRAQSPAGACGMMQLMPETARSLGVKNVFDPEENIYAGARYFRSMLDRFDGDTKMALAAYNAGPGNVQKYGGVPPFRETQRYIQKILTSLGEAIEQFAGNASHTAIAIGNPPAGQAAEKNTPAADTAPAPEEIADYLRLWSEMRIARLASSLDDDIKSL